MPAPMTFVYLIYGEESRFIQQMQYSVLSALRESESVNDVPNFLLISDRSVDFGTFPLQTHVVSKSDFSSWTLQGNYFHLSKLHAAKRALDICGGNIVLIDTDTDFIRSPAELFFKVDESHSLLHGIDGTLAEQGSNSGWPSLLSSAANYNISDIVFPEALMYNSGLVGVSQTMKEFLEEAIELAQELYSCERIFNIEQFALGHVLSRKTNVTLGDNVVLHYWGWRKLVYDYIIPDRISALNGDFGWDTCRWSSRIQIPRKPLLSRLKAKAVSYLFGLSKDQEFSLLCDLCAQRSKDRQIESIWRSAAIEALRLDPERITFSERFLSKGTQGHLF